MAKLKVMCARSMHVAVGDLGQAFARASGHEVTFDFGTVGALEAKLAAGETADVVVLSIPGINKLEKAGAVVHGSRHNVAKTFIALCIREGARKPDFATIESFKRLVEGARAIATSDPAVGGSAGVHLAKAFELAGWAAMMKGKAMPQQTGAEVAKRVVEGKAEFGLTLSGEVASVAGAVIAGPLPQPFGQDTIYCAAVMASSAAKDAAAAFIAALTHPDTVPAWRKAGFEPPHS
ncbi:molybdate ABC transporter substrate-binding protein [Rhodoplanes sp. Z2-YC6860]|uniref:molybdate ABC transporter substrate-binding protein n=1 Tax=Rhodoplanes sp. Z2-YC6860 TaxID=674703 RepID=UPI00078B3462|nr:substrate-binding domain-containing protein [Rhodoplanes sp. Z2-YC6860]AMN39824.1 molybdate ABC transporter, periplasmic molybdate-binding protein [Rhodoplanes sp. Z2-YC6860]